VFYWNCCIEQADRSIVTKLHKKLEHRLRIGMALTKVKTPADGQGPKN
jgi:hypothetical protein